MKKVLKIIGGLILGIAILAIVIVAFVSFTSKKMVCKSDQGNITIMYSDDSLTGYTVKGISYDYDAQKEYADLIGVEPYLNEFATWFSNNTNGSCVR